ncbi:MAG: mercuric transporter MerT family protein [Bacteroidota bacterium]
MEKTKVTTVAAVVAAIVGSLCCIGPVAVVVIGVGSIGAFSVFWEYRPYLIGLTAVLLPLAFYLTYRKREVICEDGTCKIESASKGNKFTVWFAAALAGIAIAFPFFNLTNTTSAQAMLLQDSAVRPGISRVVLEIEGMDCKGCAKGLEATLGNVKGVKKAAIAFEQGRAVIEYDSSKVKPDQLVASVDESGFKAKISSMGRKEKQQ